MVLRTDGTYMVYGIHTHTNNIIWYIWYTMVYGIVYKKIKSVVLFTMRCIPMIPSTHYIYVHTPHTYMYRTYGVPYVQTAVFSK